MISTPIWCGPLYRESCTRCSRATRCARSSRASAQKSSRRSLAELAPKLAAMGLVLRGVDMGKVDLPQDYRAGMEKLLAEELETEKIRYTLS